MTRTYSNFITAPIELLLNKLIEPSISIEHYNDTMFRLGICLGKVISSEIEGDKDKVCIASMVEDVDFLAKGILLSLEAKVENISFICYWNKIFSPFDIQDLKIAPIIKKYQEFSDKRVNYLIFVKSVVSEICAVRTNLIDLLEELETEKIFVASPVISSSVEQNLNIALGKAYSKPKFLYFAKDDQFTTEGELFPGIGSENYARLGFSEHNKGKYIPELIKSRRIKFINV